MTKNKVLLDSSVIIAATLSHTGASYRLIELHNEGVFVLYLCPYVVTEVNRFFILHEPQKLHLYQHLVRSIPQLPDAPHALMTDVLPLSDPHDVPVLAAAISGHVQYLVTLDQKHLLSASEAVLDRYGISVVPPSELVELNRQDVLYG